MDRIEAKWEPNLQDENEEIASLQQQVKVNNETLGTIIEKLATFGLEVNERGKKIATLWKMVAIFKKEKEVKTAGKEVGVQVKAPTIMVEQRGTDVE